MGDKRGEVGRILGGGNLAALCGRAFFEIDDEIAFWRMLFKRR
jgi:hypothetical protein